MTLLLALECTQADPHSLWLNILASMNMPIMLVTLDTSHLEMSPLNAFALENIAFMPVTTSRSGLAGKCEIHDEQMSSTDPASRPAR